MKTHQYLLFFICLFAAQPLRAQPGYCYSQSQVLAQRLSISSSADSMRMARFRLLKDLSGAARVPDTFYLLYNAPLAPDGSADTFIINVENLFAPSLPYFVCVKDKEGKSIQKAKLDYISSEYWEDCEKGKSPCLPLHFTRPDNACPWFLILPCGGSESTVNISGPAYSETLHLSYQQCPPCIALSPLQDGLYQMSMRACSLGGSISVVLSTEK